MPLPSHSIGAHDRRLDADRCEPLADAGRDLVRRLDIGVVDDDRARAIAVPGRAVSRPVASGNEPARAASRSGPWYAPRCDAVPSSPTRLIATSLPANSRSQLARIVSNTGVVSAIELLIAARTSPEARCWSSASFVSLNRRTFSIAIAAWSPKVCSSAISLVAERPHFLPPQQDRAERLAFAQQRHDDDACGGRSAAQSRALSGYSALSASMSRHLDRLAVEQRAAGHRVAVDRQRFDVAAPDPATGPFDARCRSIVARRSGTSTRPTRRTGARRARRSRRARAARRSASSRSPAGSR